MLRVREAEDPARLQAATAEILRSLPNWFGQPQSTATYIARIPEHQTLVAEQAGQIDGVLALKPHFDETGEVWLMAVRSTARRRGLGRALMAAAAEVGRAAGWRRLMLATISARSSDWAYAETRAFYTAQGFRPVLEMSEEDPVNPMVWMWRDL